MSFPSYKYFVLVVYIHKNKKKLRPKLRQKLPPSSGSHHKTSNGTSAAGNHHPPKNGHVSNTKDPAKTAEKFKKILDAKSDFETVIKSEFVSLKNEGSDESKKGKGAATVPKVCLVSSIYDDNRNNKSL